MGKNHQVIRGKLSSIIFDDKELQDFFREVLQNRSIPSTLAKGTVHVNTEALIDSMINELEDELKEYG
jgi:hypothetical protein